MDSHALPAQAGISFSRIGSWRHRLDAKVSKPRAASGTAIMAVSCVDAWPRALVVRRAMHCRHLQAEAPDLGLEVPNSLPQQSSPTGHRSDRLNYLAHFEPDLARATFLVW